MDLMHRADKADQEARNEMKKLHDMRRAPGHPEEATFDMRAEQRRGWMAKSESATQVQMIKDGGRGSLPCIARSLLPINPIVSG